MARPTGTQCARSSSSREQRARPLPHGGRGATLGSRISNPLDWSKVEIAVNTGLRRGEQFRLRWEHVDFATGILTVPRSKSGETRRFPMNDTVREVLRALPSRLKSRWVFPSETGETPRDPKNFMSWVFVPVLARAGIENLTLPQKIWGRNVPPPSFVKASRV